MKEENVELKKEGFQSVIESSEAPIVHSFESNLSDKPYIIGGEEMVDVTPVFREAEDYDGKSFEDIGAADLERDIFANSKGYQQSKGESSITSEASFFSSKKMKLQKKVEDDKQTIADMNVEGMPWHVNLPDEEERLKRMSEPGLTGKETRRLIANALLATLMVAGVFGFGIFAFILFCVKVWFV